MSRLKALARSLYAAFDADAAMSDLRQLVLFDRFQASAGIEAAAACVAERARANGLESVEILRFPADGSRQWWTYSTAQAWTPEAAELTVLDANGQVAQTFVRYPAQPYRLAAQSAVAGGLLASLVRWSRRPSGNLGNCVVVLDDPSVPLATVLAALSAEGAAGLVVGGFAGDELAHRLELPNGSALFGFSLPSAELRQLLQHADVGASARVSVTIDGNPAMTPVVVAELSGAEPGGALVYAHLCHQAPGANDNASGVATVLEVARLLAARRSRRRRGIRFVWGPEFVGLAAYLHHIEADRRPGQFDVALNLDMVGEDQARCGGPMIIERSPDHLPSHLSALAEWCVRLLPEQGRSYSGAVACDTWAWRATPFVGASDHLLLADRSIGCPSVQIGHWPDRFHHSSADTVDKVNPEELRRAGVVAATVLAATCEALPEHLPELETIVSRWGAQLLQECAQPPPAAVPGAPDEFDPWGSTEYMALLEHRRGLAADSVRSVGRLDGGRGDARRELLVRWLDGLAAQLADLPTAALLGGEASQDGPWPERAVASRPADRTRLVAGWPGPFNLRGLLEDVCESDRAWLDEELVAGGSGAYARFVALAYAMDGMRGSTATLRWASFSCQLPISPDWARQFLDIMQRAGWISETV